MAKEIGFNEVEDYLTALGNFFAQSTVLEADAKIKEATPSTTGRLRASWQIGQNAVSQTSEAPGEYPEAQGQSIPEMKGINYQPGTETIGNVYNIHNAVEYAEPVCMGTGLPPSWGGSFKTRQGTIPGFPELITKELQVDRQKAFNDAVKQAQKGGKI
jgi:hypothetical protein|tara:strand:+ start:100 stop:573 length:474 start_codon:yes stop_codon:yes gene_type:complete